MKKILLSLLMAAGSLNLYSQAPEGFSYHAIVRNVDGDPLVTQAVSFRFSIVKGSPIGLVVYEEKHSVITDQFGVVSIVIGNGTDKVGNFGNIDWGGAGYYLRVELDRTGGTSYTDMGTTQLLSVPYSLFAKSAANGFSGDYNDLINKPITDGSETSLDGGDNIVVTGSGAVGDPYIINERIHYVGESFGGGIVFYVYDNGRHGLIAATSDQDPAVEWYNGIKRYTNTAGDGVGSGAMNTTLIIALQTNDSPMSTFAAKVCADYSVNMDGVTYGDWYLPSKNELGILFSQKDKLAAFTVDYYWSSTEFSSISAWCQNFTTGMQYNLNKSLPHGVRAIRAF